MEYIIRKINQENGEVFDFIDIATTGSEFWAKKIVESLNTTEDEEFGVIPVIEDDDEYGDDGEFHVPFGDIFEDALKRDGLDGELAVIVDGNQYPLHIDKCVTNVERGITTYHAYYYTGDTPGCVCVPYAFTNKDRSNIIKL